jgi:hypothetical protein
MNAWHRGVTSGLLLAALGFGGCGDPPPPDIQPSIPPEPPAMDQPVMTQAVRLDFTETLPGAGPTPMRMLVTPRHLRIDSESEGDSGFILYDRNARVLYSVSAAAQTISVIPFAESAAVPTSSFELEERQAVASATPGSDQRDPLQVDYLADGELCFSAIVVAGLLSEAQAAEREYLDTLGSEQRRQADKLPEAMRDPCDLSRNAYAPARHLARGYPVQLWDASGYRRSLLGFDAAWPADVALFTLPAGYEQIEMGSLR